MILSDSVPLKNISLDVQINGFIAHVSSTLQYQNIEDIPIEATFTFPVDEQSAVYKFEADIDGRKIIAECQEKSQVELHDLVTRLTNSRF